MGWVIDGSGTVDGDCRMKVSSGGRGTSARSLQLECVSVLHEPSFLVSIPIYNSEIMIKKEKERFRVRAVQMDNLRGLLGTSRIDKASNACIRELCEVMKVPSDGSM